MPAQLPHPQPRARRRPPGARLDKEAWRERYRRELLYLARRFGIEGDPACADWTRLYRLPHTTRDEGGKPEDLPTEGDPELRRGLRADQGHARGRRDLRLARGRCGGPMIALALLILLGLPVPEAQETDRPLVTHALAVGRSYVR